MWRPCRLNVEALLEGMTLHHAPTQCFSSPSSGDVLTLRVQEYKGPHEPPSLIGYTNISFATVDDARWMLKMHVDPNVDVDAADTEPTRVFDKFNLRIYELVRRHHRGQIPFPYKPRHA